MTEPPPKNKNKILWGNLDVSTKVNVLLTLVIILLTGINLVIQITTSKQAGKSLEISEKSITILNKQFILLNRPYLSVKRAFSKEIEGGKKGIEVRAIIKNSGNTPAQIISREIEDLYYVNPVKSMDDANLLITPNDEINVLFMYIPPNSIHDMTPFHVTIKYKSNLSDETYLVEYWGKYKGIKSVDIENVKYN